MATVDGSASRSPAAILCSAVLILAVLLAAATTPAGASQLKLYKGDWCTGSFTLCWDSECCDVPDDAVSYKFYYQRDFKAYLYEVAGCSSSPYSALEESYYSCVQGVDFKSVQLTNIPVGHGGVGLIDPSGGRSS